MHTARTSWRDRIQAVGPVAVFNSAVFIGAISLFFFIAHEVGDGDHLPRERAFMQALRSGDPARPIGAPWVAEAARDVTALGSMVVLTALTVLVAGFLALTRRFGAALFLVAAALGGQMLNSVLKTAYGRERPDISLRWLQIDSLSFPSGHATSSAVIYLTLAVLLTRLMTTRAQKFYLFGAALLLTAAVGFSRVYLGVHYPSDVIAGWALGIAWAQLCWFAAQIIGRRRLAKMTPPA